MSIKDIGQKIKSWQDRAFWPLLLVLTTSLAFGSGWLLRLEANQVPVRIENMDMATELARQKTAWMKGVDPVGQGTKNRVVSQTASVAAARVPNPAGGQVVASKNGTKYYYESCAGAKRLKAATKLTFPNAAAAEKAGYTIAKGCEP